MVHGAHSLQHLHRQRHGDGPRPYHPEQHVTDTGRQGKQLHVCKQKRKHVNKSVNNDVNKGHCDLLAKATS